MRRLVLRNQTVLGTVNAGRVDFESAARNLIGIRTAWPGVLEKIISGRFPMAEFCRRATDGPGIKDVIAVSPE
jgi:hypothetical protein